MNCVICGKEINNSKYSNAVLCSSECFNKHFWKNIIADKDKYIIINHRCYCDGGNVEHPEDYDYLGYDGRRFWIRFLDGRTLTTNNLWYNGDIPEEFQSELSNNAEFYIQEHIKFGNSMMGGANY